MPSPPMSTRALEIHSAYIWDFDWIGRALAFIRAHDLTHLVLHQNDIVDRVVYPGAVFGTSASAANVFERYREAHRAIYKYTPLRRSAIYQDRAYIQRVIDLAERQGTGVFFEVKELSFPDHFLELYPQLVKDGAMCASEPRWWELVDMRYRELFEDLPGLTGIIVSPGSGESRVAISSNRCKCERCAAMRPGDWYHSLITAMHRRTSAAAVRLIVRDFVFDKKNQNELADTLLALPADIGVALKNTPHDYYPTFPDNPRLGKVGAREQWVEFDCMAQYYGWGIAPAVMIDDIRRRLAVAVAAGATGVMFRTDWESLPSHSVFHTPNLVNLYAGAALAYDAATTNRTIFRAWLAGEGMIAEGANSASVDATAAWIERLLGPSWEVVRRCLYVNDCVFNDSSSFPVSLDHAWWLAEEKNSLKDWVPGKANALATDEENIGAVLAEKDEGLAIAVRMAAVLAEGKPDAMTNGAYEDLRRRFEVMLLYVRAFRAVGRACILARRVVDQLTSVTAFDAEVRTLLAEELKTLSDLVDDIRDFAAQTVHRHAVYTALNWERLKTLYEDLIRRTAQCSNGSVPAEHIVLDPSQAVMSRS